MKNGFMPGQMNGIANDLQAGYGGNDQKWRNYLRNVYDPAKTTGFNFSGGNGGGKGNGGGNHDPRNPGGNPNPSDGGFEPSRPRNAVMPMGMNRPMPMQIPQMGLLNAQMPAQQQQPQGLLGNIDPQILAYLTRR